MKMSIKANYIYNLAYQIIAIAVPLFTTPYISRRLGVAAIGDYSYISGIVSYFGLIAGTGTVNFARREIAVCQNDRMQRSILFWEIFFFRLLCIGLAFLIYTVYFINFMPQYRKLFCIQYLVLLSWTADITWYFQGTENFRITSVRNSMVKMTEAVFIFALVKKESDLYVYVFIISTTELIGNLTMCGRAFKEIIWPGFHRIHITENIKGIMGLFMPVLAIQLYTVLDKTMLGSLCDTTEVGYYSQAEKVIKLALTLPSALISVLLPRLAVLYRNNDIESINKYYRKTLNFIFLLSVPMLAGCFMLSTEFVPVFFGKGYDPVINLMRVECLLFVVLSLGRLFGNFLISMNRQKKYTVAVTLAAITNMILNYIFIGCMDLGAMGAAIASVVAESISTGVQLYFIKDLFGCEAIFREITGYLLPASVMMAAILMIQNFFDGIICLLLSIITGVAVYGLMLIFCKNEIVINMLQYMVNMIRIHRGGNIQ